MAQVVKSGQALKGEQVVVEARLPRLPEDVTEADELLGELSGDEPFSEAADAPPPVSHVADVFLAGAEERAARLLADAEARAQQLLNQAQAQAEQLREETQRELDARAAKLEQQLRIQIEADYRQRLAAAIGALQSAAEQLSGNIDDFLYSIEQPAFELVLAIAQQLLSDDYRHSPRLIAGAIAQAFDLLKPQNTATLSLSPAVFLLLSADDMLESTLQEHGIRHDRFELAIDETLTAEQFSLVVNGLSVGFDLDAALKEMLAQLRQRAAGEDPAARSAQQADTGPAEGA